MKNQDDKSRIERFVYWLRWHLAGFDVRADHFWEGWREGRDLEHDIHKLGDREGGA